MQPDDEDHVQQVDVVGVGGQYPVDPSRTVPMPNAEGHNRQQGRKYGKGAHNDPAHGQRRCKRDEQPHARCDVTCHQDDNQHRPKPPVPRDPAAFEPSAGIGPDP